MLLPDDLGALQAMKDCLQAGHPYPTVPAGWALTGKPTKADFSERL